MRTTNMALLSAVPWKLVAQSSCEARCSWLTFVEEHVPRMLPGCLQLFCSLSLASDLIWQRDSQLECPDIGTANVLPPEFWGFEF